MSKVLRVLALSLVAASSSAIPAQDRPIQAIPVEVAVPLPPSPVRAETAQHLLYEAHVTNFGSTDLKLASVEIFDARTRKLLQRMDGDALASSISEPGVPKPTDLTTLPSGRRAIIFVDVALPAGPAPTSLRQRLIFAPVKTINLDEQAAIDTDVSVSTRRIPILGPPLRGGCWVASHALSNASVHRRTVLALNGRSYDAQRFAIDWIRIGPDGQAFRGDPAQNRNWSAYGADVLAVADGTVIDARDGIPENDPTSDNKAVPIDLSTVGGNHLLLDIGGGFSVFYAHLKPDSAKVHVGDRVRRGQVLGKVGNSGQADAPHLHLHMVVGKSALAAEGEPLLFDAFELQGHLPSLSVLADGKGWRPSSAPQPIKREMPVENAVVAFPGGSSLCSV